MWKEDPTPFCNGGNKRCCPRYNGRGYCFSNCKRSHTVMDKGTTQKYDVFQAKRRRTAQKWATLSSPSQHQLPSSPASRTDNIMKEAEPPDTAVDTNPIKFNASSVGGVLTPPPAGDTTLMHVVNQGHASRVVHRHNPLPCVHFSLPPHTPT